MDWVSVLVLLTACYLPRLILTSGSHWCQVSAARVQDGNNSAGVNCEYRNGAAAGCGEGGYSHLLGNAIWLGSDPGKIQKAVLFFFIVVESLRWCTKLGRAEELLEVSVLHRGRQEHWASVAGLRLGIWVVKLSEGRHIIILREQTLSLCEWAQLPWNSIYPRIWGLNPDSKLRPWQIV